jgi:hypothetical protein
LSVPLVGYDVVSGLPEDKLDSNFMAHLVRERLQGVSIPVMIAVAHVNTTHLAVREDPGELNILQEL